MSKHHPTSKPELHRPLAPSGTFGASSLPEGAMGFCRFTWVCALGQVPTVNPSVTATPCQLPLTREPLGAADQSPPGHCGGASAPPRRGDKRLAGFHMGLYFEKVPTVNPSVTATPCQLPLTREPLVLERAHCVWQWTLRLIPLQRPDWCGG